MREYSRHPEPGLICEDLIREAQLITSQDQDLGLEGQCLAHEPRDNIQIPVKVAPCQDSHESGSFAVAIHFPELGVAVRE